MTSWLLRPATGDGVLARSGDLVLLFDPPSSETADTFGTFLALFEEVAAAGGDGRRLVRRIAGELASWDEPPALVAWGLAPNGVAVLVSGAASVVVNTRDGEVRLHGEEVVTWIDRVLPAADQVVAWLGEPSPAAGGGWYRLDGGVIAAGGYVATPDGAAASSAGSVSASSISAGSVSPSASAPLAAEAVSPDDVPAAPAPPLAPAPSPSLVIPPVEPVDTMDAPPYDEPSYDEDRDAAPEQSEQEMVADPGPFPPPMPPVSLPDSPAELDDTAGRRQQLPEAPVTPATPFDDSPLTSGTGSHEHVPSQSTERPMPTAPAVAVDRNAPFVSVLLENPDEENGAESDSARVDEESASQPLPTAAGNELATEVLGGAKPSLGVLVLDDGATFTLDANYLVGRDPDRHDVVNGGQARPIRLYDPEGLVSRAHVLIELEGWEVRISDLDSSNGTYLFKPGAEEWVRLRPHERVTIGPGTRIGLGRRGFLYESHRSG